MAATFAGKLSRERRERLLWRAAYDGDLTTADAAELLGVSRVAASQYLHRAVESGLLERRSIGVYGRAKREVKNG